MSSASVLGCERVLFKLRIREGCEVEYAQRHKAVWASVQRPLHNPEVVHLCVSFLWVPGPSVSWAVLQ